MRKIIITICALMVLFVIMARGADITQTNNYTFNGSVNFNGSLQKQGTNILTDTATLSPSYIIPYALSNNISFANGSYQYYSPTNTSTIYLPAVLTNMAYSLRIDLYPGTNSFTVATNGFAPVILSTNPVFSVSTNAVTPAIFDKPYNSSNYNGWTLKI